MGRHSSTGDSRDGSRPKNRQGTFATPSKGAGKGGRGKGEKAGGKGEKGK